MKNLIGLLALLLVASAAWSIDSVEYGVHYRFEEGLDQPILGPEWQSIVFEDSNTFHLYGKTFQIADELKLFLHLPDKPRNLFLTQEMNSQIRFLDIYDGYLIIRQGPELDTLDIAYEYNPAAERYSYAPITDWRVLLDEYDAITDPWKTWRWKTVPLIRVEK